MKMFDVPDFLSKEISQLMLQAEQSKRIGLKQQSRECEKLLNELQIVRLHLEIRSLSRKLNDDLTLTYLIKKGWKNLWQRLYRFVGLSE